jgi:hypothetical protein
MAGADVSASPLGPSTCSASLTVEALQGPMPPDAVGKQACGNACVFMVLIVTGRGASPCIHSHPAHAPLPASPCRTPSCPGGAASPPQHPATQHQHQQADQSLRLKCRCEAGGHGGMIDGGMHGMRGPLPMQPMWPVLEGIKPIKTIPHTSAC